MALLADEADLERVWRHHRSIEELNPMEMLNQDEGEAAPDPGEGGGE